MRMIRSDLLVGEAVLADLMGVVHDMSSVDGWLTVYVLHGIFLRCVYACVKFVPQTDLGIMHKMAELFTDHPGTVAIRAYLAGSALLASYDIVKTPAILAAIAETSTSEGISGVVTGEKGLKAPSSPQSLISELARRAIGRGSIVGRALLKDMCHLGAILSPTSCGLECVQRIFLEELLSFGTEICLRSARAFLRSAAEEGTSRNTVRDVVVDHVVDHVVKQCTSWSCDVTCILSDDVLQMVILRVARCHFDLTETVKDEEWGMAKEILHLLLYPDGAIVAEISLMNALEKLTSFGVVLCDNKKQKLGATTQRVPPKIIRSFRPAQLLLLVREALLLSPNLYTNIEGVVALALALGFPARDPSNIIPEFARVSILQVVTSVALTDYHDFPFAYKTCGMLYGLAPDASWQLAHALGTNPQFSDTVARKTLLGWALTACPGDMLEYFLENYRAVELRQQCDIINGVVDEGTSSLKQKSHAKNPTPSSPGDSEPLTTLGIEYLTGRTLIFNRLDTMNIGRTPTSEHALIPPSCPPTPSTFKKVNPCLEYLYSRLGSIITLAHPTPTAHAGLIPPWGREPLHADHPGVDSTVAVRQAVRETALGLCVQTLDVSEKVFWGYNTVVFWGYNTVVLRSVSTGVRRC